MSLSHQPSVPSLLSYWSDSSPAPASIRLHTLAKPLMKYMYRQQALGFIREDTAAGGDLTEERIEIYKSYLWYKDAGIGTKTVVLRYLAARSDPQDNAARRVVLSLASTPDLLESLLTSPATPVRRETCYMLVNVLRKRMSVDLLLTANICQRLVSLLEDKDPGVVHPAFRALGNACMYSEGAHSMLNFGVLKLLPGLVRSLQAGIRRTACVVLGNMATHKFAFAEVFAQVLAESSWDCLMLLLQDTDSGVLEYAIWALGNVSMEVEGATATVSAGVLSRVPELLDSLHKEIRSSACRLLGIIAQHELTSSPVLALNPCGKLVALLRDADTAVIQNALYALWNISEWPDGAQAALDVEVLNVIPELLDSTDVTVRRPASYLLDKIARHEPTLDTFPIDRLLSLLRDSDTEVVANATLTIGTIASNSVRAKEILDAGLLAILPELLESRNTEVRRVSHLALDVLRDAGLNGLVT